MSSEWEIGSVGCGGWNWSGGGSGETGGGIDNCFGRGDNNC
jgi:hypothetical protein